MFSLAFMRRNGQDRPVYEGRYVDEHYLINFVIIYINILIKIFSFGHEKTTTKTLFLEVEVSRGGSIFAINVYKKPTFSGVYTHFGSFCNISQFVDWTELHREIRFLKKISQEATIYQHSLITVSKRF